MKQKRGPKDRNLLSRLADEATARWGLRGKLHDEPAGNLLNGPRVPREGDGDPEPARPNGNVSGDDVYSKRADYRRAEGACLEARGYSVK